MKMKTIKISKSSFHVYWWFFQVVCILSLVSVVIWLTLTPRNPVFYITNVHITTSETLNSTVHRNRVGQNASLIFNLETYNPNKGFGIHYEEINITFHYNEFVVGMKSAPSFYQGFKETSIHKVEVNTEEENWRGIPGGKTELRVAVETAVRYRIFKRKTKHHRLNFVGSVTVGSNGTVSEGNIKLHRGH
ncbi:hypothetical protein LguiA_025329 [Lonicera macranthoides]